MGRIKTKLIKRLAEDIVKYHRAQLAKDFSENSKIVVKFFSMPASKKIKNMVAGYVNRMMKRPE